MPASTKHPIAISAEARKINARNGGSNRKNRMKPAAIATTLATIAKTMLTVRNCPIANLPAGCGRESKNSLDAEAHPSIRRGSIEAVAVPGRGPIGSFELMHICCPISRRKPIACLIVAIGIAFVAATAHPIYAQLGQSGLDWQQRFLGINSK